MRTITGDAFATNFSSTCIHADVPSRSFVRLRLMIDVSPAEQSTWSEQTTTELISLNGALFYLSRRLPTQREVVIAFGGKRMLAKVVGETGVNEHGYCHAIAFAGCDLRFWGVAFPVKKTEEQSLALECCECSTRLDSSLNEIEAFVLRANNRLHLPCRSCGHQALWKHADTVDAIDDTIIERMDSRPFAQAPGGVALSADPDLVPLASMSDVELFRPPQRGERRRYKRFNLPKAKACIEQPESDRVVADVVDVSKGGACIRTQAVYSLGAWIRISVPYTIGGHNIFQSARVVRSIMSDFEHEYGIEYVTLM